jgi:pyridoxal phosphate-dependent aminotransferase EpsN
MNDFKVILAKYDIPVIEVSKEALGSILNGKAAGNFEHLVPSSFNGNKVINTFSGEVLVSDDEAMLKQSCFLATQAIDNAIHYQHSHIG